MNSSPDPNAVLFKSQLTELASLICSVPSSPLLRSASNAPRKNLLFSARGQDIRVTYDQAIAQHRQLLTQKACVEEILASISCALDKHKLFIKEHKPFLSSHRRLPLEIWVMVFKETTLADARTDAGRTFLNVDMTMAPFSISHVCAEWRKHCLQTPTLWTLIRILIKTTFRASTSKLLSAFLARGRNEPLEVYLAFEETSKTSSIRDCTLIDNWCNELSTSLCPLFRQHLRWRKMDVCIPVNFLLLSQLFPVAATPLLESFSLELLPLEFQVGQAAVRMPYPLFHSTPALQNLVLQDFFEKFADPPIDELSSLLDWEHLTSFAHFDPNDTSLDEMKSQGSKELAKTLLSLAPSLQSLNWSFNHSSSTSMGVDPQVLHLNLQSVCLDVYNSNTLVNIEFPSLKFCSLITGEFDLPCTDTVRAFLRRSPFLENFEFEWSSSESLAVLDDIGLPLKNVTIRCRRTSWEYDYSFGPKISMLTKENISTLEQVTFVIQPRYKGDDELLLNAIEAGRELALYTESRAFLTMVSIEGHSRLLEDRVNEALSSLEEIDLPTLEISRI